MRLEVSGVIPASRATRQCFKVGHPGRFSNRSAITFRYFSLMTHVLKVMQLNVTSPCRT
jgi:hypothetical protein